MEEVVKLSHDSKKDIGWFQAFLLKTNSVFILHNEPRDPVSLYVDVCTTGCDAICQDEAYHTQFPQHILRQNLSFCHLEALNAVVAIKSWAQKHTGKLHLFCDRSGHVPSRKGPGHIPVGVCQGSLVDLCHLGYYSRHASCTR